MNERCQVRHTVNGQSICREVETRMLLSDYIRHELGLVGTRVGCEQGVCGACTIVLDGDAVRSCLILAAQTNGAELETVESLTEDPQTLHPLQQAFHNCHALQCGFCTSGFLMTLLSRYESLGELTEDEVREALSGNLCRCTGYENIVDSVTSLRDGGEAR